MTVAARAHRLTALVVAVLVLVGVGQPVRGAAHSPADHAVSGPSHLAGTAPRAAATRIVAAGRRSPSGRPQYRDPWAIPGPAVIFECTNTHRARNDPIVFPGQPGASHRHVFFGSRTTDAFSTTRSLLAGGSGCDDARNTSAYWYPAPQLRDGRRARIWGRTRVYYLRGGMRRKVQPIPRGLKMIAGSADETIVPGEAGFVCRPVHAPGRNDAPRGGRRSTDCPRGSNLGVSVVFPNCWDGRRLDSPDHRSHLRYARDGRCRKGWVPIPQIRISVSTFRQSWRGHLSSGGPGSIHADVVAAPQRGLMRMIVGCLNGTRRCPSNSFGF